MQKKKILLIEDEPVLGEILLKKLIEAGYEAAWTHDGEKGLAVVCRDIPARGDSGRSAHSEPGGILAVL